MNATTPNYNPFRAAAAAAFVELSSDSAQLYYSLKAQEDFQTVLDNSITLYTWVYQLAELTYLMGIQFRAWCDALETTAQAPVRPMLLLAPAQVENTKDAWDAEADYELVEFSPSSAAQTFASSVPLLSPASTVICGPVWNPASKDMHKEVERMLMTQALVDELKSARAALLLAQESDQLAQEALAYVVDQTVRLIPIQQQPVAEVSAVDALAASLEVPGATGASKRQRKASTSKTAEAKPKVTTARAKANSGK